MHSHHKLYPTAGESHPQLFLKLSDHIVAGSLVGRFKPQEISNIVWASATAGESHPLLFQKLADVAITRKKEFTLQNVTNLLWAYTVANNDVQSLFNADLICVCLEKENDFSFVHFSQLHQCCGWQEELKSDTSLPPSLRKMCREASLSQLANPSILQDDVISVLASIGIQPEKEVPTKSSYRIDALVEANGKKIGIGGGWTISPCW